MNNSQQNISLDLTRPEALVLFEYLVCLEAGANPFQVGPAEKQVLWRLEGQLESNLTEPLAANYQELLDAARKKILGQY